MNNQVVLKMLKLRNLGHISISMELTISIELAFLEIDGNEIYSTVYSQRPVGRMCQKRQDY